MEQLECYLILITTEFMENGMKTRNAYKIDFEVRRFSAYAWQNSGK